ncbi:hypothetical protein KHX94_05940 [Shewanella dokdonensis]|uniref:Uncharacterized protein n=1 Tax=Shewanella dokdonensis TaxID=712036 RepID=A0ABX8DI00_9GAMM|nr:hypothetical protein [Shewanella dokdonensis]QVK24129.1 hypothetical protein KHX94_05940 [Shewanella dokdonensis]
MADSIASIPESEWQEAKIGDCKFIAKMAVNYVDGYIYRQVITNHKVSSQEIIDSIKVIFRGGGIILP